MKSGGLKQKLNTLKNSNLMGTYKGFTQVKLRKPQRSLFDLSHEKKLSSRMGKLVPVFMSETLPNDTFRVNTEVMLRLAPLLAPIYHRVNVFVHFFFVPNRLLWKDWEKFITNGRLGTEVPPVPPHAKINSPAMSVWANPGQLADYLGWPVGQDWSTYDNEQKFHLMPFAAYYKCWYDYYRDRNYVADNEYLPMASGEDPSTWDEFIQLRTRAWQHDYFTSALPWTQRGDEVLMPITPVVDKFRNYSGSLPDPVTGTMLSTANGEEIWTDNSEGSTPRRIEIYGDGVNASINDFRQAIRLQEWLERNAVAGSRYNESIQAHFARRTSDGRLQRAEYLGGGRVPVQISEVMTTAWSEDGDSNAVPPANMAGRGATYSKKNGFKYNCEEHGFVIGIMSVMPTSAYMQGLPRMFIQRNSFLDYPWPSFANLGEQPVFTYELYANPTTVPDMADPESGTLFGYQSRYSDWKWMASTAHGDFRTTLDFWHLDRKFSSAPTLGNQFVSFEDALQDRIFAVAEVDTLWCYVHNRVTVVRSLPYFGTPML